MRHISRSLFLSPGYRPGSTRFRPRSVGKRQNVSALNDLSGANIWPARRFRAPLLPRTSSSFCHSALANSWFPALSAATLSSARSWMACSPAGYTNSTASLRGLRPDRNGHTDRGHDVVSIVRILFELLEHVLSLDGLPRCLRQYGQASRTRSELKGMTGTNATTN